MVRSAPVRRIFKHFDTGKSGIQGLISSHSRLLDKNFHCPKSVHEKPENTPEAGRLCFGGSVVYVSTVLVCINSN